MIFFPAIVKIIISSLIQIPEIIFDQKVLEISQNDANFILFNSNLRTGKIFIPVTGLACFYGKISSPVTEITVTGPARLLIWTHKKFYKGKRSEVRS